MLAMRVACPQGVECAHVHVRSSTCGSAYAHVCSGTRRGTLTGGQEICVHDPVLGHGPLL